MYGSGAKAVDTTLSARARYWGLIVFGWALCVSLFFNVMVTGLNSKLSGDELDYNGYAVNVVTQHQFIARSGDPDWPPDLSRRPPAFPFFLAAVYQGFGTENYAAARLAQSLLGALLCVVLFSLGKRCFGIRTGVVTGLLASIYPYLIYLSSQLRPELFYFLAVYVGAFLFIRSLDTHRLVHDVLAALCWGIAALTHPDWLLAVLLFLIWGLWRLGRSRSALMQLASILGVLVTLLLPWTLRNYSMHHELVAVSTNLGVTIAGANNSLIAGDPAMRGDWLGPEVTKQFLGDLSGLSEVERDRFRTRYALTFIKDHPADFLSLGFWRLVRHWHFYYPLTHRSLLELAGLAVYFIILLLSGIGIVHLLTRRQASGLVSFVLILLIFSSLVAFAVRGGTRYRLLVDPALVVMAGYLITSLSGHLFSRLSRGVATL